MKLAARDFLVEGVGMSYRLEMLPDLPVLLFKAYYDYCQETEIHHVIQRVIALLDRAEIPIFHILDLTEETFRMEQLIAAAGILAPAFRHSNLRQVIVVTRDRAVRLAVERLNHDVYGNLHVPVFETYRNAIAYVRRQLPA